MPTNITQSISEDDGHLILRVEGDMMLDDALLLEKLALEMREHYARNLTVDLADLDFLDSESAPVLKRLEREHGFAIEGMEIFLQSAIDSAERKAQP
jgi:anti-anti-sigma regulatory factor